jgi:SAM-dependent methyltransferase
MSNTLNEYYKQYYEREGEMYTMAGVGETSRVLQILDWVSEHVPKGQRVLDIGCGDMQLSTYPTGHDWQGIDINISKAKGSAVEHDLMATPYPFPEASFGGIVNSEVCEHLWDMRVVHKEAHRLLAPGGVYIVTTPNFAWIDHYFAGFKHLLWDPENRPHTSEHIRQYDYVVHEKYLLAAGFDIVDVCGMDTHYSMVLQDARRYLKDLLFNKLKHPEFAHEGRVDQVLGRCLPLFSHTIGLVGRKKA